MIEETPKPSNKGYLQNIARPVSCISESLREIFTENNESDEQRRVEQIKR